jgi:hypothetical protein
VKPIIEEDYVIMGYDGSGSEAHKEKGMIGSVRCGLYHANGHGKQLVHICNVGVMSNELRLELGRHGDRYLGRVIKVGGYKRFKDGALRHPYVVGLRMEGDKRAEDCVGR